MLISSLVLIMMIKRRKCRGNLRGRYLLPQLREQHAALLRDDEGDNTSSAHPVSLVALRWADMSRGRLVVLAATSRASRSAVVTLHGLFVAPHPATSMKSASRSPPYQCPPGTPTCVHRPSRLTSQLKHRGRGCLDVRADGST